MTCNTITSKTKSKEPKPTFNFDLWDLCRSQKKKTSKRTIRISLGCSLSTGMILATCLLWSATAKAHPIDMAAIAEIESSNNPKAVGASGEIGLYQISPIVLKHFEQSEGTILKTICDDQGSFGCHLERHKPKLKDKEDNETLANWYMNWLFDRCWTVKDTIIAWNWGIGNWRKWYSYETTITSCDGDKCHKVVGIHDPFNKDVLLPKTTQDYLKKYEKLTGEAL